MPGERSAAVAGLFALAVVLAGCGAPIAQSPQATPGESPPTPEQSTPTDDPDETGTNGSAESQRRAINVTNGSLSVDPNRVFDRVQSLQGTDVERPRVVQVFNSIAGFENQSSGVAVERNRDFYRLAGMTSGSVNVTESVTRQKNGYVTGFGSIVLYVGANASTVDELLLVAHEFTHYLQLRTGRQERLSKNIGGISLTDKRYVLRSVVEGGAVVTTNAYLAAYANTSATNSEMYTGVQGALPDGHIAKYENGKYVNGDAYMDWRAESPADLSAVYADPPQTSEQVLHQLAPGVEPPAPLEVTVETGEARVAAGRDRMGEAFVRTALESAVGEQRAATAAAGWGNDSLHFLRPADGEGETAYAWVLRWDDAANQTEFQTAYRESLAQRGTETGGVWALNDSDRSATLAAPTDRTSVVVFGPDSLVRNVSATGRDGDVTVSTP